MYYNNCHKYCDETEVSSVCFASSKKCPERNLANQLKLIGLFILSKGMVNDKRQTQRRFACRMTKSFH